MSLCLVGGLIDVSLFYPAMACDCAWEAFWIAFPCSNFISRTAACSRKLIRDRAKSQASATTIKISPVKSVNMRAIAGLFVVCLVAYAAEVAAAAKVEVTVACSRYLNTPSAQSESSLRT
jgi:hypothetical protein